MDKESMPLERGIKIRDELGRVWNRPGVGIQWRDLVMVDSGNGDKLFVNPAKYQITGNINGADTKEVS